MHLQVSLQADALERLSRSNKVEVVDPLIKPTGSVQEEPLGVLAPAGWEQETRGSPVLREAIGWHCWGALSAACCWVALVLGWHSQWDFLDLSSAKLIQGAGNLA